MGSITKSPVALGALAAVLIIALAWAVVTWRKAAAAAPASGTVKVDVEKLREQVRTGGFGRR